MNSVVETPPAIGIARLRQTRFLMRMTLAPRQYCLFMNGQKYNRNIGCKRHDNAYGINGGGGGRERHLADLALFYHMREQRDPLAPLVLAFTRCFGWFFFNYHVRPWRGQLVRKMLPWY